MKVYLLWFLGNETSLIDIFTTEELAQKYRKGRQYPEKYYDIEEYTVTEK